jgi:Taurine catabolism dioxygenase TauD, TfdA family
MEPATSSKSHWELQPVNLDMYCLTHSDRVVVVSGATMFDILPRELQSLAVRAKVRYAPHPYVWMAPARSNTTGLGLLTEGKELEFSELPEWSEDKIKVIPMVCLHTHPLFRSELFAALEEPSDRSPPLPGTPFRRCGHRDRPSPSRCISRRCSLPRWWLHQ